MTCYVVFCVVRGSEWSVKVLQSVSWNPHCSVELRLVGQAAARWTLQCCSQHSQSVNIRTHSLVCLVIKEGASSPEIRQIHCRAVNYIILYGISVVVWVSSGVTNKYKTTLQFNLIIRDCNARLSHSQWWITNNKLVFFSFHHPQD